MSWDRGAPIPGAAPPPGPTDAVGQRCPQPRGGPPPGPTDAVGQRCSPSLGRPLLQVPPIRLLLVTATSEAPSLPAAGLSQIVRLCPSSIQIQGSLSKPGMEATPPFPHRAFCVQRVVDLISYLPIALCL